MPFIFSRTGREYTVFTGDGNFRILGTVEQKFFRHINMRGWEATASDGHRGVHKFRWQAAKALAWDGKGYPFPFVTK